MIKNLSLIITIGLIVIYFPAYSKEITEYEKHLSYRVEEVIEEINHLNTRLNLLSITLVNLLSKDNMQ